MKYKGILSILTLIGTGLFFFSSCAADHSGDWGNAGEEIDVTLSVTAPGSYSPATRALSTDDENEILTVEVLVFEKNGRYLRTIYGRDIATDSGDGRKKTFNVTLAKGEYDIIVLANSRPETAAGIPENASREDVAKVLISFLDSGAKWNSVNGSAGYRPIPMWGEVKGAEISDDKRVLDGIKLFRALAKTDIVISGTAEQVFELESVRLYNYMSTGQLVPRAENWDSAAGKVTGPSVAINAGRIKGPVVWESGSIEAGTTCKDEIYMFEAEAGSRSDFLKNTCLVIGGKWNGTTYYYRIDYISKDSGLFLDIVRNHRYVVTVKEITGPGFTDPDDAFESLPFNIVAEIEGWDAEEMDDMEFDGVYYYSVSPRNIEHNSSASGGRITVKTDYKDWSYKLSNRKDPADPQAGTVNWLTLVSPTPGSNQPGNINGTNILYTVTNTDAQRTAYIHVTVGRMTTTVTVTQSGAGLETIHSYPQGDIPAKGETRSVVATGNFDDILVRVRDLTGGSFVKTGTIQKGGSGRLEFDIPEFGFGSPVSQQQTRYVAFEYYDPGISDWQTIRTEKQDSYWMYIFSNLSPGTPVPTNGVQYTVSLWGEYPSIRLRSAIEGFQLLTEGSLIPAGITGSSSPSRGYINVPENDTGSARTIHLQYSVDNGSIWTTINFEAQAPRKENLVLKSTGRIVASADLAGKQNWATAMGISQRYNNAIYPASTIKDYNVEYGPQYGGCGAYSEPGYPEGTWRLPLQEELLEMAADPDAYGLAYGSGAYYWINIGDGSNSTLVLRVRGTLHMLGVTKNNLFLTRCVATR